MIAYEHEVVPRRGDVQQLPQFSDVRFDVCHFRIVLCREDRSLECRNVAVEQGLFAAILLRWGNAFLHRKTMTSMLEIEYDDSALLESLVEDIREFADGMVATDGEWGYSLRKVKNTLGRRRVWDAALRGHCLD